LASKPFKRSGLQPLGYLSSHDRDPPAERHLRIAILTHQRRSHFQRTANADLFIATLFRYREQGKFKLHGFAVMHDHVHVPIAPAIDQSTARFIQLITLDEL